MSLLILLAALAADPVPASGMWIGADTLAAPDGKAIFGRGKEGGIEAIDAATGKPLWSNKDADRLAGASGDSVFAWSADAKKPNRFRIVAIDAATGKTGFKSDDIAMPDWASTGKSGGHSFRVGARSDAKNVVVVWQANTFYYGGAAPTPEIVEAARKEAVGVVSIDPKTGKATVEDRKPRDADYGTFAAKVGAMEFKLEEQLPGFKPGAAMVTKVTLSASKGDKPLWKRELAGNPWSPPPP